MDQRHLSAPEDRSCRPTPVDTAEELAQLSQFVINIVDFRDPDCTMTHWVNPDVVIVPGTAGNAPSRHRPREHPRLYLTTTKLATVTVAYALDQYGMEYNPVAINEALAYTFAYYNGTGSTAGQSLLRRAGQHL